MKHSKPFGGRGASRAVRANVDVPFWNSLRLLSLSLLLISSAAAEISFNEHIRPILADRCFTCHGPDSASRKADLRLDLEVEAKAALGGDGDVPIHAGNPDASSILWRILSDDPDEVMPPPKTKTTVSKQEVALLREWISEGATWEKHWSFIPPQVDPPKAAAQADWARNDIDRHILARLEAEQLKPAPPADHERLLRRVSFDLTGLPPTIKALDAFLKDPSDAGYERAVDTLLGSTAFGERMALEWLDVARYGDTDGLFEDHARAVYPWRDWVIQAFNDNLPYDQFLTWQVAGDLLPDATTQQKVATGFLRHNPTSNEGGIIDEDYRIKYLIDRVNTTSMAFLGLSMECAQCHDHKFDPLSQREYYQFAGFFNSMVGKGNTKGAAAPVLKILPPQKEARLAEIVTASKKLDAELKSTPDGFQADLEAWQKDLEPPLAWRDAVRVDKVGDADTVPVAEIKPSDTKARYVRLESPKEAGFLTLSEVEVFVGTDNVARSGKAKQPTNYNRASLAAKAIDGNNNGSFASCSCTAEAPGGWWEVDLGEEHAIDHVLVFNRNDCCPERLHNTRVLLLDADRKPVVERDLGKAGYRSVLTFNKTAPVPVTKSDQLEMVLSDPTDAAGAKEITALQFVAKAPGQIEGLKLFHLARPADKKAKPLELQLASPAKKFATGKGAIVALKTPLKLAVGDQLKLMFKGGEQQVRFTSDVSAAQRAQIPPDPKKHLEYFRGVWPGFAEAREQRVALTKEQAAIEKSATTTMIASDAPKMRPTHILMRGEYDKKGDEVKTMPPASIMAFAEDAPSNRLGLAQWFTDPEHPLTARVVVNRYWQMIFGTGIVRTSEDFGTQGDRPSHQALLDQLAVDFVEQGWDVKGLLKQMVLSSTYRQSSITSAAIAERDPANRLLSHASRDRLAAEFIRDHALATSGLLVDKIGGAGVHPYQPKLLFGANAIGSSRAKFVQGTGDDLYRRSIYTYWKRQIPAANMRILGADGRTACRTRREQTNTPLQALVLLNDPQFVEAARVLGERMINEGGASPRERLAFAFRLATSRKAKAPELDILLAEFEDRLSAFEADEKMTAAFLAGGGERKADPALNASELAAYAAVASLILNLDESMSKS